MSFHVVPIKKIIYFSGIHYFSFPCYVLVFFAVFHRVKLHGYGMLQLLNNIALPGIHQLATDL